MKWLSVVLASIAALSFASASVQKPKVLLFISHDCPICNGYAPEIGRLEHRFGKEVQFQLVYCDLTLRLAEAKSHAAEYHISQAELTLDPKESLATRYGAKVTPQAVVLDGEGHVVYSGRIDDRYIALGQQRSTISSHDLANALDAVLKHQKPKPAAGSPVGCFIVFPNPK